MISEYTNKIRMLGACDDGSNWIRSTKSDIDAWLSCERTEWFAWLVCKLQYEDVRLAYRLACITNRLKLSGKPTDIENTTIMGEHGSSIIEIAKNALLVHESDTISTAEKDEKLIQMQADIQKVYRASRSSIPDSSMFHFVEILRMWNGRPDYRGRGNVLYSTIMCYGWNYCSRAFLKAMLPFTAIRERLDQRFAWTNTPFPAVAA